LVGASPGVRVARSPRRRGGAAPGVQPRHRLLRGRSGNRCEGWRSRDRKDRRRVIGVLASGNGTNLQALLDQGLPVVAVASNDTKARALDRAARAGLEAAAFPAVEFDSRERRDAEMAGWLVERDVELVVLAGYMQLLTPAFLDRFEGRILNVQPSLLPSFPGAHAVEDALAHGV